MKINVLSYLILIISALIFAVNTVFAMPNPWTECADDIYCAANVAGFNFPLRIKNYSVRAMQDMIEIKFPLDKNRIVKIRKS